MPTVVHFEIPADDPERARGFYTELFGWQIEKHTGPMEYWLITATDEEGEDGLSSGLMQRQGEGHPITNYIGVPAIDEYTVRVRNLGGEVVMPKTSVSGMGYFAVCLDTENNPFALWQTDNGAE